MSDIKNMFAKMSSDSQNDETDIDAKPAPKSLSKKQTIEKTYQKKTQLEHILLRPDTYVGSVEQTKQAMWIYDIEKEIMVEKEINYVPGLYKIFDEILVNAADNKQRDNKMDCIKIEINADKNLISVWNNGKGIPVVMHKEENMYVPTMIFGHLLTSSNYSDEEEKVTGGRNGYGAKLCNIFSTKFIVETACKEYKQRFMQTWKTNMTETSDPKVTGFFDDDFTKITFYPDLAKFKMDKLDDDIVGLMSRRAFDVAASTRGVKVFLNNKRLPIKNFKDYVDLYVKQKEDESGNPLKIAYENASERWEIALTTSDGGFQQVSFVNSIATTKGGKHVDYITDMVVKQLLEVIKKRNKGGVNIKPYMIKNHMWLFVNCLIVNPTFDSQTKETMTLQVKNFGSKCNLSEKFANAAIKNGIIEAVLSWAKYKAQSELSKTSGKKQVKLKDIPKLDDANEAGSKNSFRCTLILTEGDSAKALAVSGLGVIGRDHYGVFPLRGKLLNVREATHKQRMENVEINNLIKILGLQYKKKYNTDEDMKTLRYGKIMIMTDQDQDGSHIKGLLINFIHHNWPELLRRNFLEEFITPIVKARKKKEVLSFYSLPEFEEWKTNTSNYTTYTIKYYKGLGTSSSTEAKEYFSNMDRHRIRFRYAGQQDDDHIVLAFSKKHVDHRKEWLTNFMVESKRRKEIGLPEKYLYTKDTKFISYTDFINLELVLFSNADNVRSIPSLVDGLKPGQRKVLFTCFKRNDKKEVKVAQLGGSVAEHSAYHHGEVSLCMTIVNLAQNFVGSNNINLLQPIGMFGTRLSGGKDSASARYIFTKMSPLTRLIFHPGDDPLLKHEYDDNKKIEPVWYIPVIPMILVNGADGIGTGWMTKIPNYNPREIIQNLRKMLDDDDFKRMIPYYKNFSGTIEDCGDHRYVTNGEVAITGNEKIEITELPIGTWTQNYKENVLEPMLHGTEKVKVVISDYKNYSTDTTVKFVITCLPGQLANLEKDGLHKTFKLQTLLNTGSMCVFDEMGCLRRFDSVMDILKEFFALRLKIYQKRKNYLEGMLEAEAGKLSNQARFIMEKCSGELKIENKKRKVIIDELIRRQYAPDPVNEWKSRMEFEEEDEGEDSPEEEEQTSGDSNKTEMSDAKKFDYLLGLSMWMLTEERKNKLLAQRDEKLAELDVTRRKTPKDMWKEDLDILYEQLNSVEEKEKIEALEVKKDSKKPSGGKKKMNLQETLPSPCGRRVAPTSDEIKKKIQNAVKCKENKGKRGVKKENIADDDKDEFDLLVQSKKTLKDKLGTPEEAEKKGKNKKQKDGLKQTKLNFKSLTNKDKVNGSPKKRKKMKGLNSSNNDTNFSDSDVDLPKTSIAAKERVPSRRAATKTKYIDSTSDSNVSSDEKTKPCYSSKDVEMRETKAFSSESESEPCPRQNETSEDLFDSLIGKKDLPISIPDKPEEKESELQSNMGNIDRKRAVVSSESERSIKISDSDSDFDIKKVKKPQKKTKKNMSSDEGSSDVGKKKPKSQKRRKLDDGDITKKKPIKSKARKRSSDAEESDIAKKKLNKLKKMRKGSSDESDFEYKSSTTSKKKEELIIDNDSDNLNSFKPGRSGRATKQPQYIFDDSEDSSD